jgi:hypothetical protein
MNKSIETIQRIVLLISCLFKELYIWSWQWFHLDIDVLCVEKARVQQLCCCMICANEVGIRHVFDYP